MPRRADLPAEATLVHGEPSSTADSARNRVAQRLRTIADLMAGRPLDEEVLARADADLDAVATALGAAAGPGKVRRGQPTQDQHPQDYFPESPVTGYANPIAAPVDVWVAEGEAGPELRGRAFFGYAYEGPPTCVHGGVLAELFDEMLGSVNILVGVAGMTGTLTVRYRRPTPLLTPLDLVARQTGVERRKIFAWGGIYHEGVLTAEAEGIFILLDPERMLQVVTENAKEAQGDVLDPQLRRFVESGGQVNAAPEPFSD